jgi:hypothetical protein
LVQFVSPVGIPIISPTPRINADRYATSINAELPTTTMEPISRPTSSPCTDQPFTISAGNWYNRTTFSTGSFDKSIDKYCGAYGAPQEVYYGSLYRPYFAIFEDDRFIKHVDVDVGIQEVNGRNTYGFHITALQAGCRTDTPSFKSENSLFSNISKCYDPNSSPNIDSKALNKEYEIFNSTNGNAIRWEKSVNGIYLFEARVLDPDYSYCTFSTKFAVKVVGAPSGRGWQFFFVFGFNTFGLTTLFLSYVWYSYSKKLLCEKNEKLKDQ